MNDSILKENENKRLTIRLPLLMCFALYNAWQMGVIYFSGETLSLGGRTPLPIHIDNVTIMIVAGYILSLIVMIALSHYIVWIERISAGIALLAALSLFLPLPPATLAFLYYVQCFFCIFMIGFETAIIVNLFTEMTALKHMTIAYALSNIIVASLHNEFFKVPFPIFGWFTVIALSMMLLFFCKLPAKKEAWPCYLKKGDGISAPKPLLAGIPIFVGLNCFANLFGTAVAESITHGVSVIYISALICGVAVYLLWKWVGIAPIQSCSVLVLLMAMGFVAAIVAQFVPAFSLPACVLIGAGITVCWLNPFLGVLISKRYPSKYIAPAIVGTAFLAVLIHTVLLEALRDNLTVLYVAYLVIAVGMALLYLKLEPYLLYSFRGKKLISDERAIELNEAARAAGGEPSVTDKTSEPEPVSQAECEETKELTDRERQVAQELMSGYDYKEIAKRLYISPHTVAAHRKKIYGKLEVHNVPELIAKMEKLTKTQDEGGGQ